jgi:hypothetical protein
MKLSREQLRSLIKEEVKSFSPMKSRAHPEFAAAVKGRKLNEASEQGAVEAADRAITDLLDIYIDKHLDGVGSNQQDAIEYAAMDLQEFFGGYSVDELYNNYEIDLNKFGI